MLFTSFSALALPGGGRMEMEWQDAMDLASAPKPPLALGSV